MMEYKAFGKTGLKVSAIGFGCWEMGGEYGHIEESEVIAAINRAVDLGINCFDTTEGYGMGKSEALLAKALGNRRKEIIVVTKFGIRYPDKPKGRDSSRQQAMSAIERSLKFLNTDYVDVYLVHWPDVNTPFEETMRTLDDIVKQGKARFVGVSNFTLSQLKECMSVRRVDIVQYGYHLFDRRMEKEIFPYCAENGIGVMAYGSLAHGLLTGTFTEETKFEETDWRSKGGAFGLKPFAPENFPRNVRTVNELKPMAQKYGKKMPHLALRWVHSNPAVSVALVGARNPNEVEDNMGALGWTLSQNDKSEIDGIFQKYGVDVKPDVWLE